MKNVKLHYEIIGDGKPIIILHGLGCNLNLMKCCMEPIFNTQSNYKRIYIDLPGMGQSTAPTEYATSDHILEILVSFIENIEVKNFLLIGESYGGYLATGAWFCGNGRPAPAKKTKQKMFYIIIDSLVTERFKIYAKGGKHK